MIKKEMKMLLFLILLISGTLLAGIFISIHFGIQITAVPVISLANIPILGGLLRIISGFFGGFNNMMDGKF